MSPLEPLPLQLSHRKLRMGSIIARISHFSRRYSKYSFPQSLSRSNTSATIFRGVLKVLRFLLRGNSSLCLFFISNPLEKICRKKKSRTKFLNLSMIYLAFFGNIHIRKNRRIIFFQFMDL